MTKQRLNSICRLSHSPEERSRLTFGEKGFGFKSVVSFSRTPDSHSGNLHCRFGIQVGFKFTYSSESIREKMTAPAVIKCFLDMDSRFVGLKKY